MERRDFIKIGGVGVGALMLPITGIAISADQMLDKPMDVAYKKKLADIALNAAKTAGASYA
ncbi:MAG: TldD protein, partial [Congregibacter sp.]